MPEGRLTLWKLHVLVAVFALAFAPCYWLLGPVGGFAMMITTLPLWTVAAWLFLSERQSNLLMNAVLLSFFLLVLLCWVDYLMRAAFGFGLPVGHKGLLVLAWLYCITGLSVAHSLARFLRNWEGRSRQEGRSGHSNFPSDPV
jgi:hypothetical protein